ncbi:tetratricopeptide repeat protein [Lyngbya confervoides]|uniref:Tetratricopeptide repeat protein n=1 Tax=Lyngbya confervoides BDU141951 TaxID=1574623 RepID=A0ABD4T6Y9_9CYAN|nr:tetratricopeptide repeat protein [Lyngbya confervoides]MCM1984531.1 tetratricopeptide repeat protein [Lyngbya confervoides BDU141951]
MFFKTPSLRRALTLMAGAFFAIGMGQSVVAMFLAKPPMGQSAREAAPQPAELAQLEAGYKLVLAREPQNPTALRELLNLYLAQADWVSAREILERLRKQQPQEAEYSALLADLNQKIGSQGPLKP